MPRNKSKNNLGKGSEEVVLQDMAILNGEKGTLILTSDHIRFERYSGLSLRFETVFDLPLDELQCMTTGLVSKTLLLQVKDKPEVYKVKVKHPENWIRLIEMLKR